MSTGNDCPVLTFGLAVDKESVVEGAALDFGFVCCLTRNNVKGTAASKTTINPNKKNFFMNDRNNKVYKYML